MKPLAIVVFLLLAGCVSPEQRMAQMEAERREHQIRSIEYTEGLRRNCTAMGFKEGTEAHSNCILAQHQQNQANQGAMMNSILQGAIQQQQQQQYLQMRPCSSLPPGTAGYARASGTCR